MFDVGDLPVLTFGNCASKTGVTKWPLKLYGRFLRFFSKSKKHDSVVARVSRTSLPGNRGVESERHAGMQALSSNE